jgi:hypothetical protein
MQQIQAKTKTKARQRHTTPADPPTLNSKIARIWFSGSQPPAPRKSAG